MKFLVIAKQVSNGHKLSSSQDLSRVLNEALSAALSDGSIEAAYAIIAGGFAYILNADSAEELARNVRFNPLFRSSSVEILPVSDARMFLSQMGSFNQAVTLD
ncbi:hypothetical protein NAC44_08580 [Allorhizobium sp. BGMRC 0089]|uniref:hypothetical protein n=1 Tax=Allorhizobium sonneratiae TaxID=2934936 RepID=UPI0020343E04|nr:hypothetical protein [Allorhizobium sonneratiae]MCM2292384.1 hypothetical protein [Allorhizobium sonneratiae]